MLGKKKNIEDSLNSTGKELKNIPEEFSEEIGTQQSSNQVEDLTDEPILMSTAKEMLNTIIDLDSRVSKIESVMFRNLN